MTHKDCYFFLCQCLSLAVDESNKQAILRRIKSDAMDWEKVVFIASSHYLIPALYLRFQTHDLLKFLPEDLVAYLEHITELNRERNERLMLQARAIISTLNEQRIYPIFLKGMGYILEGIYENPAERMLSDIDFLVNPAKLEQAVEVLKASGYFQLLEYDSDSLEQRHYPRLGHHDHIGGIEVHRGLVRDLHKTSFHFEAVKPNLRKHETDEGSFYTLSYPDQILLNCHAAQLHDNDYLLGKVLLRHQYDLLLLAQKSDSLAAIKSERAHFSTFNDYLNLSSWLFQGRKEFKSLPTLSSKWTIAKLNWSLQAPFVGKLIAYGSLGIHQCYWIVKGIVLAVFSKKGRAKLRGKLGKKAWWKYQWRQYREV